jgi:uncharacterized membrane protein YhfC
MMINARVIRPILFIIREHINMLKTVSVSSTWVIAECIVIVFAIAYPLVLAMVTHRRLNVSWKYFWYGTLVFLVSQLLTRVPLQIALQSVFAQQLKHNATFFYIWLALAPLTAGIFEEVGRYFGYRIFMRREEKTWRKAVMYGIGHGGLESIVLVGLWSAATVVGLILTSSLLNTLPVASRAPVIAQIQAVNATPAWMTLLGAWERLWTLPIQIAFSVIVLQVFRRRNLYWLWLAILAHTIVDELASVVPVVLQRNGVLNASTSTLLAEALVFLCGLVALWIIRRLKEQPVDEMQGKEEVVGV